MNEDNDIIIINESNVNKIKNKKKRIIIISTVISIIIISVLVYLFIFNSYKNNCYDSYTSLIGYENENINKKYKGTIITNLNEKNEIINFYDLNDNNYKFDFSEYNYLVDIVSYSYCSGKILGVEEVVFSNNMAHITYIIDSKSFNPCASQYYLYIIPISKEVPIKKYDIEFNFNYKFYLQDSDKTYVEKPIIYIYPKEKINLTIKLENSNLITTSYPKYDNEWDITVDETGNIFDNKTKRNYYALYWEGINNIPVNMNEGFVVKGEDTISFLEEKLKILGLNDRETNEFIIYWLPKMEKNNYNFIRFSTIEEINNYMPMKFNINPDVLIRVYMDFKALNSKINVKEQKLVSKKRHGFTVVEWGGRKIKEN